MSRSDVEVAITAAEAGAVVVRAHYGRPVDRHTKGGLDFATDADLEAERAIRTVIEHQRPDDAIVGEEYGATGSANRTWLVDPLCGTLNFAAHTPLVATNVALREGADVTVAAVSDPLTGEVFSTSGQDGARLGTVPGELLSPSSRNRLVDVDLAGDAVRSRALLGDSAFQEAFAARGVSSTLAVVWTAAGRYAGYVTDGDVSDNVHYAAGLAVCRAAGCPLTDLDGGPVTSGRGLLLAADDETHAELLALLRR